jgi:hypothetical protein
MIRNEIRMYNSANSGEIFTEAKEIKIILKETLIAHAFTTVY